MITKEFNKKLKEICLEYDYKFEPEYEGQIRYVGNTPFGKIQIISSPSPRIKLYTVYMRFLEDFEIDYFFRYFSKNEVINRGSKKWNLHKSDADYVLNEVDERINNLNYILRRDGKVCGEEHKPFLEEIEN